jgi:hypothetical protein
MSKNIEKFIEQNRHLLDVENIPEAVWEKIKLPTLQPKKSQALIKPMYKWAAAAVVTALLGVASYFLISRKNATQPDITVNKNYDTLPPVAIKNLAPEYAPEAEEIYNSIAVKQQELKDIAVAAPELYKQFASDLATLDSSYRVLKTQASSSPNHDVIIKAMIQNLQLQAELLNRQLLIMSQFKNSKKETNETKNNLQRT